MYALRLPRLWLRVFAVLALAGAARAQVTLSSATPSATQPGTSVTLAGTGFPSGTILAANVTVTITPPSGGGSPVTTAAGAVTGSGSSRTIVFLVPAALTTAQPLLCQVSVAGTQNGTPFSSSNTVNMTVQPPAAVSSAAPAAGQMGTTATLTVVGAYTHFTSNTALSLTGPGTTGTTTLTPVTGTTAFSTSLPNYISAQFAIPANATPGSYTVWAKTGTEKASLAGGFLISSSAGLTLCSVSPDSGAQGAALNVTVCGVGTHFAQGVTQAYFGDGITVTSVNVAPNSGTSATLAIQIDPLALTGPRTLTVATGGEFAIATNGFTILPGTASLQSISQTSGAQGTNATVTLTGLGTHWTQAATTVSFGPGINVGNISNVTPTSLTANISIGPGAALGPYTVTATTNGEIVSLPNAFTVVAATPYLSGVSPTSGQQGQQNLNVTLTGVFTSFNTGTLVANFGPNITVNSVAASSATSATANIGIAGIAATGARTATLTSNNTNYSFSFTVTPSAAAVSGFTPNSGNQGASVALQVTGSGTHWVPGLTTASLDPNWITINRVIVSSPTSAEVDITIAALAPVGARTLTMSTGGEVVTFSPFTVLAYTPTLSVFPASGMIGTATTPNTVQLNFSGYYTHFTSQTTAVIDGNGATLSNLQVPLIPGTSTTNPVSATATLTIVSTAPATPGDIPCPNRTITFTTPFNGGSEIVTAGFCVTSTPAVLTGITPSQIPVTTSPVTLNVEITGAYTHFTQGVTTVGLGPNITVNSVTVNSLTDLIANITIPPNAVVGDRPVFVNTINEQLEIGLNEQLLIGFRVGATSASLSPSAGEQGQSLTVSIAGSGTNFNSSTIPILGAGVSIDSMTVGGPTSITAQVSIDPLTPVGPRSVTLVTPLAGGNEEVVSEINGFTVSPGIAAIATVGSSTDQEAHQFAIQQGQILTFMLTGSATHWLQGETTVSMGSDVAVSQLSVIDPTHISLQIAVSYTATLGFRAVTATTSGEIASSFSDAVNVTAAQATMLNITPTTGAQGTTVTIQVNGIGTHWTSTASNPANNTTASFGNNDGLNITAINVISATQMNLTLQILGTAYPSPALYSLTVTTTGVTGPPQSTEQLTLSNVFAVSPGAAIITNVTPPSGNQGTTAQIAVTGQLTNFLTGTTTAAFSTGGCLPANSAGINVTNVTASGPASATLSIAITPTAATGYQTLCMYTLGETVSYSNAFQVLPGNPTLNEVAPVTGEQGQTLTGVEITGQFTSWNSTTVATFGQGITVQNLQVTSPTTATANLVIDPLANIGGRQTTMTTGSQIVSGNFFSVVAGPGEITGISPAMANQGQEILMTVTGQNTHWSQGLTQFSISGAGYDITVNGVQIASATSAIVDLTVSGTAALGTRTVSMSTGGENVSLQAGFLVTGGIPAIISVSPNSGRLGDVADNILITGVFTNWTPLSAVDFGDPCITVAPIGSANGSTWDDSFNITAVVSIGNTSACTASLGVHTVTVRTTTAGVTSAQTGQFIVYNSAGTNGGPGQPPEAYISYEYPSVALVGQTLMVSLTAQGTNWLPDQTTAAFGAGIQLNSFQVTGLTSAVANITIASGATVGSRTVSITTGTQTLTTSFYVTVGQPAISLVDPSSAIQGETRLIDLVGQYTTWTATGSNPTQFTVCAGVTITPGSVQIFGPTAARMQIVVSALAPAGSCAIGAITGAESVSSYLNITPGSEVVTSVSPNTAIQGSTGFVVNVVGFDTLWTNQTVFSFGSGVTVTAATVTDNTDATLTLSLDPYASPGVRTLSAATSGQIAYLNNAFVVQPGTPILLSSAPGSAAQQSNFDIGILGQYTSFNSGTTVVFPSGGVSNVAVNVTSAQSITVTGVVNATAYPGCGNIVVTTPGQSPSVLTLSGAFCIAPGPAAITSLTPDSLGQGQTGNIQIAGANTNFLQGTTVGTFGPGISVNTLTINSPLSATANITVAANATPEINTVTLTTAGETATDPSSFTIFAATSVITTASPVTGAQAQTNITVNVTGAFTHFVNGNTTASFGAGITVNSVTVSDSMHAAVSLSIQPTALVGQRDIQIITNLTGGAQEVAVKSGAFTITAGPAAISAVTPVTPAAVHQGDNGDVVTITGSATHFTAATPTLSFCAGITVVAQVVNSDTQITATISVPTTAPLGACGVTVSTLGEIASGSNLFNIMAGVPAITGLTPNSAHQGDGQSAAIAVGIAGRYTHFTSGGVSVSFGSGITVSGTPAVSSDTALSVNIQVDPAATLAGRTVTVTDATDGTITLVNGFSVAAGVPAITSVTPATGAQGSTQTLTITGSFTSWTVSSVVSLSGGGDLTVGSPAVVTNLSNGYQQTIQVPVTVTTGAAATARTVTVTTGGQQLSFANAFTVLPGMPNITQISPNIGVPNSTVTVTITGQFTNWVNGTTVANFGPGVSVNGGGSGATGTLTINNAYTATATLTVDANATLGSRNVTVTTGTQILTVTNGFTVQADTTTPPSVTYVSPTRGAQNVPINSRITVVFSEPMNPASFAGNTILSGPGGVYTDVCGFGQSVVPVSTSLDASGRILTVTPAAQLSVGSGYALSLNFNCNAQYISDQSGNVLPALYSPFTTGFAPDTSGPTFTEASVANGASGLPINANIALGFNKPLNAATVATGLSIMQGSNPVPGTWSYSSDFTQAMFYPASNLTPSAGYTVAYSAALTDAVGNPLTNPGTLTFTTAATTDTSLPQILSYTPQNGITTGTNPFIRFAYNKPINPLTVTPATFYLYTYVSSQGDVVVNGTTVTVSPDNTTFTLNLSSPLQAGMQYYVTSSCVYDWAGNGCGYGYTNFITGTGVDSTAPVVTSVSPPPSFTCGSNPCAPVNSNVEFQFSKSMDPTSLNPVMTVLSGPTYNPADAWSPAATFETGFTNHTNPNGVWSYGYSSGPTGLVTLFDQATQGAYNGPNAQFWLSSTVNNGGSPSVEYNNGPAYNNGNIDFLANQVVLVAGVGGQYADLIFTAPSSGTYSITSNFRGDQYGIGTSVGVVANGSVLFSSSVTADAQNVPFSTQVSLTAGSTVAFYAGPGSGNQNTGLSVIITNQSAGGSPSSGPIPGTFSFSNSSGSLLTFTPSTTLLPSSTYTISLSGGLQDVDGNIVAPFTSTFTTGSSALPDGTQGTITGTPSNGGTNVPVNSTVVLQLSKPVDWATVNSSSFYVFDSSAGVEVPGTIAHSADYQTLTFTPTSQYQPNHQICYSGGYQQSLYDLTGSPFAYLYYDCFTTGSTADTTPPTVTSVSPLNSATGIGPRNPVIVTLSKSLNPGAISGNVALYNGSTLLTQSYTPSSDYTTFTFNTGQLPYSTTLTVIVSPNVTDLAGNRLASEFSSTFTTGPQPTTSQPQINAMRPGSGSTGVSPTAAISFFVSAPLNPATVNSNSVKVSQNGVLLNGTVSISADNQDVVFTPAGGSFQAGALIQVWFTNAATDAYGNQLYNFQSSFTIQQDLSTTPLNAVSYNPCYYCGSLDLTGVIEILMNKPVNPATAIPANFYVTNGSGNPVSGAISLLDSGRLLRFQPASPLTQSTYYYVNVTTGLQDLNGLAWAGNTSYAVYTNTTSNTLRPAVIASAPTSGSTAIGTNAVIGLTFNENVDQNTVDPSNVTLTGPSGNIPLTASYNPSNFSMTVTPQAPLPPGSTLTLTLNGITDNDGNTLNPTPYTLMFTTGPAPDYAAPVLLTTNVTYGQTGVPVTTSFSMIFNKPIDWRSVVYPSGVYLYDYSSGYIPATVSPIGSNGILITPTSLLPVDHNFYYYACISDLNGNSGCSGSTYFTTAISSPSGGPQVTQMIPPPATTLIAVNFQPMVQFDRPVNPRFLSGATLTQGGSAVQATPVLSSGGTVLTLVPASLLLPNQPYQFSVSGMQDSAGNGMAGSVSRSFTTGSGIDLTTPQVVSSTPINGASVGTNPVLEVTFNKPINPIQSASFSLSTYLPGLGSQGAPGAALSWASDFKSVQFTYPGALNPNVNYYWSLSFTDLYGNYGNYFNGNFQTGSGADTSPETVTSVTPPSGIAGVPLNAVISIRLVKPAAPVSVTNASLTLSPAVSGSQVQLSSDGYTLTVSYSGQLAPSTLYTISVPAGGLTDQDGNPVSAFSSTFTTGTSADNQNGTISMTTPAPGATGVPLTQAITATFSAPYNPDSLTPTSFVVCGADCNTMVAGSITQPSANTLVFTPAVALPANSTINVYVGYYYYSSTIYDLAGNVFSGLSAAFTTASTVDNTPPQVTGVTPASGATNVGPYAPVALTFNKSLDYTTITSANFALYNGSTNLNASVSYSNDRRIVYLNTVLPYGATISVLVSTNVRDYNGNYLTAPYSSTFAMAATPLVSTPSVIQVRPTGSGAALNSPITLYMSAPMNASSVQSGIFVSQNGVLIQGSATLTPDRRGIVWAPGANYLSGATINVFLTPPAADVDGNQVGNYSASFRTATVPSPSVPLTEIGVTPCRYCQLGILNPVFDVQFSGPVNPATVTASSFYLTDPYNNPISGAISFLDGNTVIRFSPSAPLAASTYYYYVHLTTAIQDTFGNTFSGDSWGVSTSASAVVDNTPPTVQAVTPPNGSTGIGDNAVVKLVFSKIVDTLTIGAVNLSYGSTSLAYTTTFTTNYNGTQTVAILTPSSPLPDNATIAISLTGITDLSGNALPSQTASFQTGPGSDFTSATVITSINSYSSSAVPINSTFTATFSKALDPSTVTPSGFYVYISYPYYTTVSSSLNVSPDGRTVTIAPTSNLTPSQSYYVSWSGANDLDGNSAGSPSQYFTTAAAADTTPPTVVSSNPLNNNSGAPTNSWVEVDFNKAVRANSLGSITLSASGSVPFTATLNSAVYGDDTVVRLIPAQLLMPNTTYTVNVSGVQDVAGNVMSGTYTFSFTTGLNFQTQGIGSITPSVTTASGTFAIPTCCTVLPNVLDNPTFTVVFDHSVDYASFLHNAVVLLDQNNNTIPGLTLYYSLSTDQTTLTITTSGLAPASTYILYIGSYYGSSALWDIAGNSAYAYNYYNYHEFSTQ